MPLMLMRGAVFSGIICVDVLQDSFSKVYTCVSLKTWAQSSCIAYCFLLMQGMSGALLYLFQGWWHNSGRKPAEPVRLAKILGHTGLTCFVRYLKNVIGGFNWVPEASLSREKLCKSTTPIAWSNVRVFFFLLVCLKKAWCRALKKTSWRWRFRAFSTF